MVLFGGADGSRKIRDAGYPGPAALRRVVEEHAEREMLSVSAWARQALARAVQPEEADDDHR